MFGLFRSLMFLSFISILFLLAGCPPSTSLSDGGPPSDGKENPQITLCPKGATCLFVKNEAIRSCSILLESNISDSSVSVEFLADIKGRSKQVSTKVGLSFIWKKNVKLIYPLPLLALKFPSSPKKKISWKILKKNCYDAKGKLIDNPNILLKGN